MAHGNSPLGMFPASVPIGGDAPDVRGDLALIIGLIEPFTVMRFTTRAARDNAFSTAGVTLVDGMVTWITGTVDEKDERINGVWVKTYPIIYNGTGTPANSLGVPGDLYIKYT